ncbi:MAG: bifunctional phosphopantothenoylcysteine decarboxylase/phosphopantothenate--cysteine ligase CoaBC [Aestuariivita sp.]|nr:bifunctional phosphopantothenoylcysteine decarboxylase/phosphopantothenate--cysteine ligase CoaBC [Aestuariivita sp.]
MNMPTENKPESLAEKRILLLIGGGIAAYKSLELIRRLKERGASVTPVLTAAGEEFVTPLSVSALAEQKVYRSLFDYDDEVEMGHIQLSRKADLLVVAPATADLMAKAAAGIASDLATTLLLATDKPALLAPAMNVRMWEHVATQRNYNRLLQDGIKFVGPAEGEMACGEYGPGRMAEVEEICLAIGDHFSASPRINKRVIVTSGPTRESIDPVRYISNRSSGAQGTAIAQALISRGVEVVFVSGPSAIPPPAGVHYFPVETAREMDAAVNQALPADAAVFAAAVADWRARSTGAQKLKKATQKIPQLDLIENPDILAGVAKRQKHRPKLVVGFAAETEDIEIHAQQKLKQKACDWIVANDVSVNSGIVGGKDNAVTLVRSDGLERWPSMSKLEVGNRLADRILAVLNE